MLVHHYGPRVAEDADHSTYIRVGDYELSLETDQELSALISALQVARAEGDL